MSILLFYLVFVPPLFLVPSFIHRIYRPIWKVDYLIVLGAGSLRGKEVSSQLARRIGKVLSIYRRRVKRQKAPLVLVMSGGQGGDEEIPEAVAMRQYALSRDISEVQILVED